MGRDTYDYYVLSEYVFNKMKKYSYIENIIYLPKSNKYDNNTIMYLMFTRSHCCELEPDDKF